MTASIEVQALAQEWLADPEAMSDIRREALLDWVRDEQKITGLGPAGMSGWLIGELGIGLRLAVALVEEAGFGTVAPAEGGPKETT